MDWLFTKSAIAQEIADVTYPTFNTRLNSGEIFQPYTKKNPDTPNARSYYTLADAMRISIIWHGAIRFSHIYNLISSHFNTYRVEPTAFGDSTINKLIRDNINKALTEVRNQIAEGKTEPCDLMPYLKSEASI